VSDSPTLVPPFREPTGGFVIRRRDGAIALAGAGLALARAALVDEELS
jgi:hypothetical protein